MKKTVLSIVELVCSVITFPLWFAKIFVGIGHLPNAETGKIEKIIFRHSAFENICDSTTPILIYVAMSIIFLSIILNLINLKIKNKKLQVINNIIFGVAIGFFILLFLYASTVRRGY